ncbi:MAG: hypothetical protein Q9227_000676 [Pyrenula ochraceoflavens]
MEENNNIATLDNEKDGPVKHLETAEHVKHINADLTKQESHVDETHIALSWRSWLVVFVTCFAITAQVFVVTAAGSVIAFIIRDLGEPGLSGWIIQGPLLMQSVLSPIVGRLSDVLDRRYLASIPPLIAFIGAVVSAKATSMAVLIGGGILIGVTLATISIVQAIPSEVLPLKYRALANGFAFLGGAIGGLIGEWKGRPDGILAHVFFRGSPNFALSIFAFAVEGWIFYSAVNSITPQVVLNLGWETSSWRISIRQLSYTITTLFASLVITAYSTKYKDLKSPLLVTFTLFLIVVICYATVNPSEGNAQYGFNVLSGIGQSGPLTLLVALVQFTAPHAFLSTATGLAFSARAIGGAFGSAVLDAIINGKLGSTLVPEVGGAAIEAGLPRSSVPALLAAFQSGEGFDQVRGINATILAAATEQSHWTYARAYRLGWASIIPFVVIALVAVAFLRGVKDLMTEHVEATVEKVGFKQDSAEGL